jgi:hypothetical protein
MKRREFITLLARAVAWSLGAYSAGTPSLRNEVFRMKTESL